MPASESFQFGLGHDDSTCHILPCSINYEGPVDLNKFPIETSPRLFTRLRGRPLQGRMVDLSAHGYCGINLDRPVHSDMDAEQEEEEQDLEAELEESQENELPPPRGCNHTFKTITVWEHGKEPAEDDAWSGRLEDLLHMSSTMEKLQAL